MARVKENYLYENKQNQEYIENPITENGELIQGYFNEKSMVKEMAIRKINKTLCGMLSIAIIAAFASYYFSMTSALELNALSRKITAINDENADLQNSLDEMKSFNNVDFKMSQFNVLQKPEKVIEVQAIETTETPVINIDKTAGFNWAIGY
ncbi:hypothetical protein IJF81_02310 [bacterium]|nr:hypothetical protein [bacterium]